MRAPQTRKCLSLARFQEDMMMTICSWLILVASILILLFITFSDALSQTKAWSWSVLVTWQRTYPEKQLRPFGLVV